MPQFPQLDDATIRERLENPSGKIRLVIDTDTHNEIDDQFAIAWALMSQDVLEIEGVLAEPYSHRHHREPAIKAFDLLAESPEMELTGNLAAYRIRAERMIANGIDPRQITYVGPGEGMELSYQEILKVYELMDEPADDKIFRGSPTYLEASDKPVHSAAVDHLIECAMKDDDRPLYVAAIGCVTNIVSAMLIEPSIIEKIVVLWTSSYPSIMPYSNKPSLNLVQDVYASQLLFDSGVPLVYLPGYYIGEQLKLSLPDVERWVQGKGKIGDYLYDLYANNPHHQVWGIDDHFGRTWVIWDLINFAWLLNADWVPGHIVNTPVLTDDLYWQHSDDRHPMFEATKIDRDAIFRDFFHKLAEHAGQ